jgi:predicted porin
MTTSLKISTLALASVLAAASFSASAQSTVTVYGKLDLYMQYAKGAGTQTAIQSGGQSGSRIGFKGTEDLGDGLKALFVLEAGVGADTGASTQGGLTFGRQAFVGLSSTAGKVTLGRQYRLLFNQVDSFDPFATGAGSSQSSGIISAGSRANNAIVYEAPKMGDFTAQAMVSLGETATTGQSSTNGNEYSASVVYAPGALNVGLGLQQTKRATNADKNTTYALATASYDFGILKLTGGVQSVNDAGGVANVDRMEAFGGVLVPVGKDTFSAGVGYGKTKDAKGTGASQFSLGYSHPLSARTNVYAVNTYINNGANTQFTSDSATGTGPVTTLGKNVSGLQLGIRHSF